MARDKSTPGVNLQLVIRDRLPWQATRATVSPTSISEMIFSTPSFTRFIQESLDAVKDEIGEIVIALGKKFRRGWTIELRPDSSTRPLVNLNREYYTWERFLWSNIESPLCVITYYLI